MKKSGWQFLVGIVLVAVLFGACVEPFGPPEDPVEYDAQGRRLVTVNVDVESATRAVNTDLAKAYIDFYEVVFVRDGAEYYSATTTKGAGKKLSLRVPNTGTYEAFLYAGYLQENGEAVLLAQAKVENSGAGYPIDAPPPPDGWKFSLAAIKLTVNGQNATPGNPAASVIGNPIRVQIDVGSGPVSGVLNVTSGGIPYYKLESTTQSVTVTVDTKVLNTLADHIVTVVPKGDTSPIDLPTWIQTGVVPAPPTFTPGDGLLKFGFAPPAIPSTGLSTIGFDVEGALLSNAKRANGLEPIVWHIRNGLDANIYDDGLTITGGGLVFAWGSTVPVAATESTGVNLSPSGFTWAP
jgi:hypothetical protein